MFLKSINASKSLVDIPKFEAEPIIVSIIFNGGVD
jgi:hypothetical protein